MEKYIIVAIISTIFFGTSFIVQKKAPQIDAVTLSLISVGTSFICILIYWLFNNANRLVSLKGITFGIASGIVSAIAFVLLVSALRMGKANIVSIINSFSSVVAIILAFIILSEKLTITQSIGAVLAVASLVLVAL